MSSPAEIISTTEGLLADQILSTSESSPNPTLRIVWTGTSEVRNSATSVRHEIPIRLAVLEFILLNPGHDSEEIASALDLPFELVDDEVAAMCAKGLLAPE